MKKTKRGAKRFVVMMMAVMLMAENVSMPAKGEAKKSVSAQMESVSEQISDNSVEKYAEVAVSANFVSEEETEVEVSAVEQEKVDKEMPVEGLQRNRW